MKTRDKKTAVGAALFVTILLALVISGCTNTGNGQSSSLTNRPEEATSPVEEVEDQEEASAVKSAGIEIPHLHGLGFSPDGLQLIIPAHDGLRIYEAGAWSAPDVPAHDYMGYSPSSDGFYSSGHPHPSSSLVNPLGLVKSSDSGRTLETLGFSGESDFHLMAVGYENHAVYVLNPQQNSRLAPGLHYTLDDGQTWQQSALEGLTEQPFALAVHPTDAATVALATETGLLLSTDQSNTFASITTASPTTAVSFAPDGETLLYGYQTLYNYNLTNQQSASVPSPAIAEDDAISYIAVNPVSPATLAFATFNRDLYFSQDGGQTWQQIAQTGATKDLP